MWQNSIEIELLSDLCSSSGESLNSQIDNDVCYDDYGLPYIPGKRIKGLMRESAQDLADIGLINQDMISLIFGEADNRPGWVYFASAELEKANSWKAAIDFLMAQSKQEQKVDLLSALTDITHQQSVLDYFTSVRSQTRIDEYGIADDGSLRSTRVVNRDHKFICPVYFFAEECQQDSTQTIDEGRTDSVKEALARSALNLRYMGLNRTRGLGRVNCNLDAEKWESVQTAKQCEAFWPRKSHLSQPSVLKYILRLDQPCILQTSESGGNKSDIFIDGSRIMGMCLATARRSNQDLLNDLLNDDSLIFSFAYISDGHKRFLPLPLTMLRAKDVEGDERDKIYNLVDRVVNADPDTSQAWPQTKLSGFDSTFFNGGILDTEDTIQVLSVDKQINYHHKHSDNKSVGRADGAGLYQLEALRAGQYFAGQIQGPRSVLEELSAMLRNKILKLGASKTAEYGRLSYKEISIDEVTEKSPATAAGVVSEPKQYVLLLHSPLIMYNNHAMPMAKPDILKQYLSQTLSEAGQDISCDKIQIDHTYSKTETIGGYQRSWALYKPVLPTYVGGSAFIFSFKEAVSIDCGLYKNRYLGERTREGYGEYSIYPVDEFFAGVKMMHEANVDTISKTLDPAVSIQPFICLLKAYLRRYADNFGRERSRSASHVNASAVNRVRLMLKESTNYQEFKAAISSIKTDSVKEAAMSWIVTKDLDISLECLVTAFDSLLENTSGDSQDFKDLILDAAFKEEVYRIYLNSFLSNLRLKIRMKRQESEEENPDKTAEGAGV